MIECKGRKCLKEINPEKFPGVYWGIPYEYDPDCGCCCDCRPLKGTETGRISGKGPMPFVEEVNRSA